MEGNQKKSRKKPVKKTPAKNKRRKTTKKKSRIEGLGVWIAVAVLGIVVLFSLLQRPSDLYDII